MTTTIENKDLTRIPQPFTFDPKAITHAYGEQAHLVRDVLVFVANKTTTDFFGDITFTLDEFCAEFGYRAEHLQKTLPQFRKDIIKIDEEKESNKRKKKEEIKLPIIDGHCFDSVFEYALYKGFTQALIFSIKDFEEKGFDLKNLLLFSRIKAVYKKTGRKEKRHYLIELDYRIKEMQLNRFFLTDKKQYTTIQIPMKHKLTGGLRNFYLYMGQMVAITKFNINQNLPPHYILTVDQIAKIMELSINRSDNKKKKVNEYLLKLTEILKPLSFSFSFFKGENQRYAYSVKFEFPEETINHFNQKNISHFFDQIMTGRQQAYFLNVINDKNKNTFFYNWLKNINEEEQKNITKWLFNKEDPNFVYAKEYFLETFKKVFGYDYNNEFGKI